MGRKVNPNSLKALAKINAERRKHAKKPLSLPAGAKKGTTLDLSKLNPGKTYSFRT